MNPGRNIAALVGGFRSSFPDSAWREFLATYSASIMKVVDRFDHGGSRDSECFQFVCEKLCEADFRRLRQFDPQGRAAFESWLATVVFNLCVDWHRKEFGRVQMMPAIAVLPAFDQQVYQLVFEQTMTCQECLETLRTGFPDLTRQQVSAALARVHKVLTPRQRWQLSVRNRRRQPHALDERLFAMDCLGPYRTARAEQESRALQSTLAALEPAQRRVLALRFSQGLTLKQIAEVLGLGDPYRAHRQVQAALDALATRMHKEHNQVAQS
jgi:RNA polymerase sigma factor (sigma-70 family)